MSGWGDFSVLAKNALLTAQKKIDKALEIDDDEEADNNGQTLPVDDTALSLPPSGEDEFFNAFGLHGEIASNEVDSSVSHGKPNEETLSEQMGEASGHPSLPGSGGKDSWSNWINPAVGSTISQSSRLASSWFATGSASDRNDGNTTDATTLQTGTLTPDNQRPGASSQISKVNSDASFEPVDLLAAAGDGSLDGDRGSWQTENDDFTSSFTPIQARLSLMDSSNSSQADTNQWQDLNVSVSSESWMSAQSSATLVGDEMVRLQSSHSADTTAFTSVYADEESVERVVSDLVNELTDAVSLMSPSISSATNISPPGSDHSDHPSAVSNQAASPSDDLNSDIELVSTPTCDTMSERSSRSGVMINFALPDKSGAIASRSLQTRGGDVCSPHADQRIYQMAQVLESRELKLIELSRENMRLIEDNELLQSKLNCTEKSDGQALQLLQQKFANVSQERDQLRRKLEANGAELDSNKKTAAQLQKIVAEKDEQISELMHEGDRLSKQELKHNNIIKKLRQKEKESENQLEALRTKLTEIDNLKAKLKGKDAQEVQYDEAMHQLKSTQVKNEKRLQQFEQELADMETKNTSLQNNLENAYRQISELQREKAASVADFKKLQDDAANSRETELGQQLDDLRLKYKQDVATYGRQMEQLQQTIDENERDMARRQQSYKWELEQANRKMEDADLRNQELSDAITAATQPLLRQIDNLQSSFNMQQANWERLEKSLYDRLADSDRKLAEAHEKERQMVRDMMTLKRDNERLSVATANDSAELNKLREQLKASETATQQIGEMRSKFHGQLEHERDNHRRAFEELQKEKELLGVQFDFERNQAVAAVHKQLDELQKQCDLKESMIKSLREQLLSVQFSDHIADKSHKSKSNISPSPPQSLYMGDESSHSDWLGAGSNLSSIVEKLRERLHQRDAELGLCREDLRHVQAARDNACTQLGQMRAQIDRMEEGMHQTQEMIAKYSELNEQHQALLQMYGEKVEENDELRMDLDDIKQLMKQQFETMVSVEPCPSE